jgi:hypothetical protein
LASGPQTDKEEAHRSNREFPRPSKEMKQGKRERESNKEREQLTELALFILVRNPAMIV